MSELVYTPEPRNTPRAFNFPTEAGVKQSTGYRTWLMRPLCFCLSNLQLQGCCLLCL